MGTESIREKNSLLRFQSNFVLPFARLTFLAGAALATLVIVIGLATALFFQLKTMGEPERLPVPPEYSAPLPSIDLSQVDARLSPPREIRFIVTRSVIDSALTEGDVVGFFDASTPNGLAKYPDDFSILGGEGAEFFRRVRRSEKQPRSALAPTAELVQRIESVRNSLKDGETKEEYFSLKAVARDIHGSYSTPTDIRFKLAYGLPRVQESPRSIGTVSSPTSKPKPRELTPMQQLAHEIALTLDPDQTTRYYDFNQRALQIPKACGAHEDTPEFMLAYRRAFEHVRERLTPAMVEAFYAGLCDSWKNMLGKHATARATAEAARNAAMQKNRNIESNFNVGRIAGWAARNWALYIAGGAFSLFLVIALSLAVLASENHNKVARELAEAARSLEAAAIRQETQIAETPEKEAST